MLHSLMSSGASPNPTRDLWYGTRGPKNAKIVIVGESWGAEEAQHKVPFVGTSGFQLSQMLKEAGIPESTVLFTNVIAERPQFNETFRFFNPKSTPHQKRIGGLLPSSLVEQEVGRLYRQLADRPRDLVIAAGNWSLWALSRCTGTDIVRESNGRRVREELQTYTPNGIMNWRGSMLYATAHPEFGALPPDLRLLPIIHPAAIQRAWYYRSPTVHDLRTRVPMALRGDWRMSPPPVTLSPQIARTRAA
jgi:uracil-DNA glycosylase